MTIKPSPLVRQIHIHDMYLQHHDWLLQWLKRRISYPLSAPDIVQDTFVRLFQAQHQLNMLEEPRAYLLNIAKHLLIDQHRRYIIEKNYLQTLCLQSDHNQVEMNNNDFEQIIHFMDFLTVALSSCHAKSRMSFIMYYFEGYKQSEIALQLGLSLRAIQNYLADCLSLCYETRNRIRAENYGTH